LHNLMKEICRCVYAYRLSRTSYKSAFPWQNAVYRIYIYIMCLYKGCSVRNYTVKSFNVLLQHHRYPHPPYRGDRKYWRPHNAISSLQSTHCTLYIAIATRLEACQVRGRKSKNEISLPIHPHYIYIYA